MSLIFHVPNWVLGIWVVVAVIQVWGKYMILEYLDPEGVGGQELGWVVGLRAQVSEVGKLC